MDNTYKIAVMGIDAILPFSPDWAFKPSVYLQEAINTLAKTQSRKFRDYLPTLEDIVTGKYIPETVAFYDQQLIPALILILTQRDYGTRPTADS